MNDEIGTAAHLMNESNPFAGRISELKDFAANRNGKPYGEARKKLAEQLNEDCEVCTDINTPAMRRRRNGELSMSLQRDAEEHGWTTNRRSDTYFQARRAEKDGDDVLISEHIGITVRDDGIDIATIIETSTTPAAVIEMFRRPL